MGLELENDDGLEDLVWGFNCDNFSPVTLFWLSRNC